jgi:hypothetical protein
VELHHIAFIEQNEKQENSKISATVAPDVMFAGFILFVMIIGSGG